VTQFLFHFIYFFIKNELREKIKSFIFIWLKRIQQKCRLMSAKGGLMMGTKKAGTFSSRQKKA